MLKHENIIKVIGFVETNESDDDIKIIYNLMHSNL